MKRLTQNNNIPIEKQDIIQELSQKSMKIVITDDDAPQILLPKTNLHYQSPSPTKMAKKRHRLQENSKAIFNWNHLLSDLMRLVINKLNYQDRLYLRATCKNWNNTELSESDFLHDMPLSSIALILMKTSNTRFRNFFNFLIFWIRGQTQKTVKALLHHIPIQELHQWGHNVHRPDESMFAYFMSMAQRLGNMDAEFYWVAVDAIIQMINLTETKLKIIGMILALKKIGGQIYPDTIFDTLDGPPICNAQLPDVDNNYKPDGYPVHPDQMDDYTCPKCKVALLMGCLSAYLTESIDFYLDLF